MALGGIMVSLGQVACEQPDCGLALMAPPTISVLDAKTKAPICDANIYITSVESYYGSSSGPAVESPSSRVVDAGVDGLAPLQAVAGDGSAQPCTYTSNLATGIWTLQVSHAGYATETVSNVYEAHGACSDPQAQQVVVLLYPTGS
jgi:hypothetical protein